MTDKPTLRSADGQEYCIVPVKVDGKMEDAARDWSYGKYGKCIGNDAAHGCFDSMLAARPALPADLAALVKNAERYNDLLNAFGTDSMVQLLLTKARDELRATRIIAALQDKSAQRAGDGE